MTWASPHITFAIWVRVRVRVTGMSFSLGFGEWGCSKRGDAHITVTALKKSGASFL